MKSFRRMFNQRFKGLAALLMLAFAAAALAETPIFYNLTAEKTCQPGIREVLKFPTVAKLIVPRNALSSATDISMTIAYALYAAEPNLVVAFSPHGTVFNVPVTLKLMLIESCFNIGDKVCINYYDDATELWTEIAIFTITDASQEYMLELDHFSLYAFSRIKNGDP
jgi:hypothetical protein